MKTSHKGKALTFGDLKVGQVMIRPLFGVLGLALLWGAVWWFLVRH